MNRAFHQRVGLPFNPPTIHTARPTSSSMSQAFVGIRTDWVDFAFDHLDERGLVNEYRGYDSATVHTLVLGA